MKRKLISLVLALVLLFTLGLTACGDDNEGGGDVQLDDKGNIIKRPDSDVTNVTFWANCDSVELDVFTTIVNNFNAAYKDTIKVNLIPKTGSDYDNALKMSLNGTKPPDVFYVGDNGYKAYAELGWLYDVTSLVNNSEIYRVEDMWDNVVVRYKYDVTTGTNDGPNAKYYGVPKDIGPTALFYNETIFARAGVRVISVYPEDLAAFNSGAADSRGKTKVQYGITGEVKEKGYFIDGNGQKWFNNKVPMSWQETVDLSYVIQAYDSNVFGYFTEWWFNYGWSVGGDCIQYIPTADSAYEGGYWDFTLMDNTANFIVADDVASVVVNGKTYKAGEIIAYADKVDMTAYAATPDNNAAKKGTYTVTSQVLELETDGKLNRLPSQREAFTEFVRLAAKKTTVVDNVQGEALMGYEITPYPTTIGGDAGKTNSFANGKIAMLVDGRWNVTNFRRQMTNVEWDVAPLPMYKEYDAQGNITVHGIQAGHSGSVGLCISSKSKVVNAAWKFIEYCASEEGQTLQAQAGFAVPLQRDLANSEVYLQSNQKPYNSVIFLDAIQYEKAGDWWYLTDKEWIDDWANLLNGNVRNGTETMTGFFNSAIYDRTFELLQKYTKAGR